MKYRESHGNTAYIFELIAEALKLRFKRRFFKIEEFSAEELRNKIRPSVMTS